MSDKRYIKAWTGFEGETDPLTISAVFQLGIESGLEGGISQFPVGSMIVSLDSDPAFLFLIDGNDGLGVSVKHVPTT
jgi:hypothetical protein